MRKKKLEEREPPSEEDYEFVETCEPAHQKKRKKNFESCSN